MGSEETFDEKFDEVQFSNYFFASIVSRTLKPDVLTKDNIDKYVSSLHSMLDPKYFDQHGIVEHGDNCPEETIDIFKLPQAKPYSQMQ